MGIPLNTLFTERERKSHSLPTIDNTFTSITKMFLLLYYIFHCESLRKIAKALCPVADEDGCLRTKSFMKSFLELILLLGLVPELQNEFSMLQTGRLIFFKLYWSCAITEPIEPSSRLIFLPRCHSDKASQLFACFVVLYNSSHVHQCPARSNHQISNKS